MYKVKWKMAISDLLENSAKYKRQLGEYIRKSERNLEITVVLLVVLLSLRFIVIPIYEGAF